jgi:hypothetical protein
LRFRNPTYDGTLEWAREREISKIGGKKANPINRGEGLLILEQQGVVQR